MSEKNKKYQVNIKTGNDSADNDAKKSVNPDKYKNFDQVYKSYSDSLYKGAWYKLQFHQHKNRKVTVYIILILVVTALVLLEFTKD